MQNCRFLHSSLTILLLFIFSFIIPNTVSADPPDSCPCFSKYQIAGMAMAGDEILCINSSGLYQNSEETELSIWIRSNDETLAYFVARDQFCLSYSGRLKNLNNLRSSDDPDPEASDCLDILEDAKYIINERTGSCDAWCRYSYPDPECVFPQ